MRFFLWRLRLYFLLSGQEENYQPAALWKYTAKFREEFDRGVTARAVITEEIFFAEE